MLLRNMTDPFLTGSQNTKSGFPTETEGGTSTMPAPAFPVCVSAWPFLPRTNGLHRKYDEKLPKDFRLRYDPKSGSTRIFWGGR